MALFFKADRGADAQLIAFAQQHHRGVNRLHAVDGGPQQVAEEDVEVAVSECRLRDAVDGLQQLLARLGISHGGLADRLVERRVEAAQVAKLDAAADARLPQVEDRAAQQAVFGDDVIEIEPAREAVKRVVVRQRAQRGRSVVVRRGNDARNLGQDAREMIDERSVGQACRRRQHPRPLGPHADDLRLVNA